MPAPAGLPERVRRDPGPGCRRASGSARRTSPSLPTAATCRAPWSLETSWDCGEGWIVVRDCLLMGPWRHEHPGRSSHTRPPTDYDAEHTLLRTVRCVHGTAQLVMDCEPVFDYGRIRASWRHTERGYYQAADRAGRQRPDADPDARTSGSGLRARARGRARCCTQGDTRFARCPGAAWPRPRTTTRPTGGWSGPRITGSTGWPAATSPTIAGAATWRAAR